jgi:hypothetical protein
VVGPTCVSGAGVGGWKASRKSVCHAALRREAWGRPRAGSSWAMRSGCCSLSSSMESWDTVDTEETEDDEVLISSSGAVGEASEKSSSCVSGGSNGFGVWRLKKSIVPWDASVSMSEAVWEWIESLLVEWLGERGGDWVKETETTVIVDLGQVAQGGRSSGWRRRCAFRALLEFFGVVPLFQGRAARAS